MIERNYFEQYQETAGGNSYYIDYKRKALISAFYVVGNCLLELRDTTNNN